MSDTEQQAYLDGIRRRRLAPIEAYKKAAAVKQQAKDDKTRERIEKESTMMEKELAALDKALEKVEARAAKLTGLRLMVENMVT